MQDEQKIKSAIGIAIEIRIERMMNDRELDGGYMG
jgi:hypothetical protein